MLRTVALALMLSSCLTCVTTQAQQTDQQAGFVRKSMAEFFGPIADIEVNTFNPTSSGLTQDWAKHRILELSDRAKLVGRFAGAGSSSRPALAEGDLVLKSGARLHFRYAGGAVIFVDGYLFGEKSTLKPDEPLIIAS